MKTLPRFLIPSLAIALASVLPVSAQVITSSPNLPVLSPAGAYMTPAQVHATYSGPGLTLILSQIQHSAFGPVNVNPVGPNEIEIFNSGLTGLISVNGSPDQYTTASGPVTTEVFGKVGNVTGTFNTEMLSMNLTGNSPFGPYMIRESPTLASTGQTTITDIGGGLYQINSFFDVFTELSLDGGASWIPSSNGPAHVVLGPVPEPSTFALAGLGAGLLAFCRSRRLKK
jgi:hypothetical protein